MIRALVAGCALSAAGLAHAADVVEDWLSGRYGAWPAVATKGAPLELKWSHPAPPVSVVPPVWNRGLALIKDKSGGRLAFTEYGAGKLHGPRDGFKAVREGLSDWATCYAQYEGRGFELMRAFEQPFVAHPNPMVTTMVAHELAEKYFRPEFERAETYFGYYLSFSNTDIMSRKPVRRLEDLRGMKIVAQGFPPEAARALGATLVNIPYPEVYTALQQGVVDAVVWVWAGFLPYKVFEIAKYHTTIGLNSAGIPTCINRKFFDGLPRELKDAFYQLQQPLALAGVKITQKDFGRDAAVKAKAAGAELIVLSPEEVARWRAAVKPSLDKWVADNEAAGRPARALLADIERLKAKYEKMSDEEMFRQAVERPARGLIKY